MPRRRAWLLLLVLLLFGCMGAGNKPWFPYYVHRWHDSAAQVTCWIYTPGSGGGISCLPDAEVAPEGRQTTEEGWWEGW